MRSFLVCIVIFFFSYSCEAQVSVSGIINLEAGNELSGTRFIYTDHSLDLQSDTLQVGEDGLFTFTLEEGIYTFRAEGSLHKTHHYFEALPVNVQEDLVLQPIELGLRFYGGQIFTEGAVISGNLEAGRNHTISGAVTTDGIVEVGEGANIYFAEGSSLTGSLKVNGTKENPVQFLAMGNNPELGAYQLRINGGHSSLAHTSILHLDTLFIEAGQSRLKNVTLKNLHLESGQLRMSEVRLQDASLEANTTLKADCSIMGSLIAADADTINISNSQLTQVLLQGDICDLSLTNNLMALINGEELDSYCQFEMYNCVFNEEDLEVAEGNSAMRFQVYENSWSMRNNIFSGYEMLPTVFLLTEVDAEPDISYNLFENAQPFAFVGPEPDGLASQSSLNVNGDSIDIYNNQIDAELLYFPDFYPILQQESPAIGAGDPDLASLYGNNAGIDFSSYCIDEHFELVWPGDSNLDQTVNMQDIFAIGLHYGMLGPVRENASIDWIGQPADNWEAPAATPLDIKYADTDGNGEINRDDLDAIVANYESTYDAFKQEAGDAPIYLEMPTEANAGDTIEIKIMLGTDDAQVAHFYGISFSVEFDADLIEPNSLSVSFADSWVGQLDEDFIALDIPIDSLGRVDIGICRINLWPVHNGSGTIGTITCIVNEDVIGKDQQEMTMKIGQIRGVNRQADQVKYIAQDASMIINANPEGADLLNDIELEMYPQPCDDRLFLSIKNGEIKAIEVMDLQGNVCLHRDLLEDEAPELELGFLTAGVYFLAIQDPSGYRFYRKFIKQ